MLKTCWRSRLAGDKEARRLAAVPPTDDKKRVAAVKLEDEVLRQYEKTLVHGRLFSLQFGN